MLERSSPHGDYRSFSRADGSVIDGVFFDCFNFAYQLPSPWNRHATNIPNCTVGTGGAGCEGPGGGPSVGRGTTQQHLR